jgi:AcrR family transcriptional regulator
MNQNASRLPEDDPVVARTAQRALARRQAAYADEVRRLLDAGLEVMRQCGTTKSPRVSDIVEAGGLSRDAFYRHFVSKEDLVAAIVEAGANRLVSYLRHQMEKQGDPKGQLRKWVEGIMAQAADPEVAHSTRAVLWNGGRVGDRARPDAVTSHAALVELIIEPLGALGSSDPERDAAVICDATMGRMRDFLWRYATPTKADVAHMVRFCTAAVGASCDDGSPPAPVAP